MLHLAQTPKTRRTLIKATDGAELGGQLYIPDLPPRAAIVLNGATGVPQSYYQAFSEYAAATHGMAVLTYDYRDTGRSSSGPLRHSKATMADWGVQDQHAARRWMQREFPGTPLWIIGHSLGGMTLPMQPHPEEIDRVVCVASGMVHFSEHPWPYRALALLFWYGLGPVATALCGYLPGRVLGFGSDLPAPAYWQWRRWCTTRGFFAGAAGTTMPKPDWPTDAPPVHLIAFSDDDLVPERCVERLATLYHGPKTRVSVLDPVALGLKEVGHLGAFSRRNKRLWETLLT